MKLVTVAEMQAIERESNARGWTYEQMMERAGQGLAEMVESFYGYEDERSVVGLVGSGNNGGDTLVALAELAKNGWQARAYLVRPRAAGDALVRRLEEEGGDLARAEDDPEFQTLNAWMDEASVLLDGVLGTGIKLPLKDAVARVLGHVRDRLERPAVVAVDCPSGVDLDTGEAAPEVLPADLTVCMAAVKTGLLRLPAYRLAGSLEVVEIGLPQGLGNLGRRPARGGRR